MQSSCIVAFYKIRIPWVQHDLYLHTFPFISLTCYFDNTCHDLHFTYINFAVIVLYLIVGSVKCICVSARAVRTSAHMGRN
jgi:hypothetical protein